MSDHPYSSESKYGEIELTTALAKTLLAALQAWLAENLPTSFGDKMSEVFSLNDAIYNCRAMRRIKTDEVPEEMLLKLIDAANQAPSGSNTQKARWIVVRDPAVKQQLADQNRKYAAPYIAADVENPASPKQKRLLDAVVWQMEHLHEIPALIVACFDYPQKVEGLGIYRSAGSVWPGIQNILLSARSQGLGAAPTTLALRDQDTVRQILKLPETFAALCLIPVGYPMGKFGPVVRKARSDIMRFDSWD
jgi:nitroreductase